MTDEDRFWVGPESAPDTYQLITCLGGGAEGEVWTAILPLSAEGRRNVAVKILPPGVDGDDEAAWTNHGHLLRSIAHPGLVRVLEAFTGPAKHRHGQATTQPARYVVMDLIEGVTLREWLDDNPGASASLRLRALITVAAALDEMHSGAQTAVPVAHGDVKPSNIVIRPDGSTVLVDLGLTRLADGTGRVGRSRPYAAPELFAPGAGTTPEADRFAFAATVVHAFLGEPPPLWPDAGPDLNQVAARLQSSPLTARRPILINKLMEALAAPPAQRPANLRTWLSSLTDTLSQVTESSGAGASGIAGGPPADQTMTSTGVFVPPPPPVVGPVPMEEPRSHRRRLVAVCALVLVLLIGGGAAYAVLSSKDTKGGTATPVGNNLVPTPTATGTPTPSTAPSPSASQLPSGPPSGAPSGDPDTLDPSAPPTTDPAIAPSSPGPTDTFGPAEGTPIAGDDDFVANEDGVNTNAGNIAINGQVTVNGFLTQGNCCGGTDTALIERSVSIDLGRSYTLFHALLGIEDKGAANVPIEFKIYADQKLVFDKKLKLGTSRDLTLNVTGVLRMEFDFKGELDEVDAAVGDPKVK